MRGSRELAVFGYWWWAFDVCGHVRRRRRPTEAPGEKFSWVDPDEDPPIRVDTSTAYSVFDTTTNVEDAPSTFKLYGRAWLNDIPG